MSENKTVRVTGDKTFGKDYPLSSAFGCAARGVVEAFGSERNVRIDAVAAAVVVVAGFALGVSLIEWCVLVLCIALVASLEIVNTAIESVVDLASPEYHELARRAKDCAAGAVFLSSMGSALIGLIIFVPRFIALFV